MDWKLHRLLSKEKQHHERINSFVFKCLMLKGTNLGFQLFKIHTRVVLFRANHTQQGNVCQDGLPAGKVWTEPNTMLRTNVFHETCKKLIFRRHFHTRTAGSVQCHRLYERFCTTWVCTMKWWLSFEAFCVTKKEPFFFVFSCLTVRRCDCWNCRIARITIFPSDCLSVNNVYKIEVTNHIHLPNMIFDSEIKGSWRLSLTPSKVDRSPSNLRSDR